MKKKTKSREPLSSVSEPTAPLQQLEAAQARHAETERALQESEALYRAVVESLTDGIAITVGTTRAFVNKAFLDIHGLKDASQVVGLPVDQFILPEYRQEARERVLAREHGDPVEAIAEYKIQRPDGEVRTVQASTGTISFRGKRQAWQSFAI